MTEAPRGKTLITPGFIGATVLVVALFAFWGMSNSLNGVLMPQFRKTEVGDADLEALAAYLTRNAPR